MVTTHIRYQHIPDMCGWWAPHEQNTNAASINDAMNIISHTADAEVYFEFRYHTEGEFGLSDISLANTILIAFKPVKNTAASKKSNTM